jgi:hypothetical protein
MKLSDFRLRIMCMNSMPAMILAAQWKSLNPGIGRVRRLMAQ